MNYICLLIFSVFLFSGYVQVNMEQDRLSYIIVDDNLKPGRHTVTISISDDFIDKESILRNDRREKYRNNPEIFEGNAWYPVGIMILKNIK